MRLIRQLLRFGLDKVVLSVGRRISEKLERPHHPQIVGHALYERRINLPHQVDVKIVGLPAFPRHAVEHILQLLAHVRCEHARADRLSVFVLIIRLQCVLEVARYWGLS